MLEEYIPEAVAYIIVIDVSRARGLQKDKVLTFFKQTILLSISIPFIQIFIFGSHKDNMFFLKIKTQWYTLFYQTEKSPNVKADKKF